MPKNATRTPTAKTADRHDLYQRSVQSPDTDSRFLSRLHKRLNDRPLRRFREDFCGTALLSCHMVQLHRDNRALGVDLDESTLEWGRQHNLSRLEPQQRQRIQLQQANVLDVTSPKVELTAALNFSYCVFKTRPELTAYFRTVRRGLVPNGLFVLDTWGGSETQVEQEEERDIDGEFTYVWDQHKFDPLTYHTTCRIHFEFRDGTRLRNAYVYDWRLWTVPEIREMIEDAGFRDLQVYWEGTDRKTNEGSGVFRKVTRGDADQSWIAYVIARA